MQQQEEKNEAKRIRRTNAEIDRSIAIAVTKLAEKTGFWSFTLSAVSQQAKIEPPVLYKRFGGLQGLLEDFIKRYDYWFNDIIDNSIDDFNTGSHKEFISKFLKDLAQKLYKDKVIQRLLVWELIRINKITDKTAVMREANTFFFSKYYENHFKSAGIDFNIVLSLIMAGIYYLIAYKDISTFCTIDYSKEDGLKRLLKTIDWLVDISFEKLEENKKLSEMIRKMKEDNLPNKTIAKYTGLSVSEIASIK